MPTCRRGSSDESDREESLFPSGAQSSAANLFRFWDGAPGITAQIAVSCSACRSASIRSCSQLRLAHREGNMRLPFSPNIISPSSSRKWPTLDLYQPQ